MTAVECCGDSTQSFTHLKPALVASLTAVKLAADPSPLMRCTLHNYLTVNDEVDSCTVCPVSGSATTAVNVELMSVDYEQCLISVSSLESSARQQEDKHTTTAAAAATDDDDDDVSGGPVSDSVLGPAELLAHYKVTAL